MATQPERRLFTIDEYERMADTGILHEDDRVELIEGEIIEMAAIGSRHAGTVNWLNRLFTSHLGDWVVVSVQNPVRLPPRSEPQPDLLVLRPRPDFYRGSHPEPSDVLVLVEVSDSTVGFDRGRKMPLYARQGIRECWFVNLDAQHIEVYREPTPNGYGSRTVVGRGEGLSPEAFPELTIEADELLGL